MWQEFKAFLLKQNALALAIGVVIGGALDSVVKGLVGGLIMPIVSVVTPPGSTWQTWVTPGPIPFQVGTILSALLNFVIIGFVAWRLSKVFIRDTPKPATKACPYCLMEDLDLKATRCPHCTSEIAGAAPVPGGTFATAG
jgi:large conductance mechanosensitive channel